jgi:hypothetical protein
MNDVLHAEDKSRLQHMIEALPVEADEFCAARR